MGVVKLGTANALTLSCCNAYGQGLCPFNSKDRGLCSVVHVRHQTLLYYTKIIICPTLSGNYSID